MEDAARPYTLIPFSLPFIHFLFFFVVFHSIGFFHLNLNFLVFVVVVVVGVGVGVVHIEIQGEISFIDLFICPLLILFLCVRFR